MWQIFDVSLISEDCCPWPVQLHVTATLKLTLIKEKPCISIFLHSLTCQVYLAVILF